MLPSDRRVAGVLAKRIGRTARLWLLIILVAGGAAGCVDPGEFRCAADSECVSDDGAGVCQAADPTHSPGADNRGWCSFSDGSCESGRRYGELSGDRADACVSCGGLGEPCCGEKRSCDDGLGCAGSTCSCVTDFVGAGWYSCARKGDGSVWCWGSNNHGALGVPGLLPGQSGAVHAPEPVQVQLLDGPDRLAASGEHNCAIVEGSVRCWGYNGLGQLGDGTTATNHVPVQVATISTAIDIALTTSGSCAALADGTVSCWGVLCPNFDSVPQTVPAPLSGLPLPTKALASSTNGYCALLDDGSVWCWEGYGCTDATQPHGQTAPAKLDLPAAAVTLQGSADYYCARLKNGSVWCWGIDRGGVVGDYVFLAGADYEKPVLAARFDGTVDFVLGGAHACGLYADGSARCWGQNHSGQLGDGTTAAHLEPEPIDWSSRVDRVFAARVGGCVVSLGRLRCWGANDTYQLGDGTTDQSFKPTEPHLTCP